MASELGLSSVDPYDESCDEAEYLMPENVAETTPKCNNHATPSLTPTWLDLTSPLVSPENWGHVDPYLDEYHSKPMVISSTL